MPGITLLGLGPGDPNLLTREAWNILSSCSAIWLRTLQHPIVAELPAGISLHSFDEEYEKGDSFEGVYASIARTVLELGREPEGVIYGVPGHPFVAESTGTHVAHLAKQEGLPLRVVAGISFLEPTFSALGIDPYPRLQLCDALALGRAYAPTFAPDTPVLIAQVYSRIVASEIKSSLNDIYPDDHVVWLVHFAGTRQEKVEQLALYEIDRSPHIGALTSLYVPPLAEGTSFEALQEVVAHLRSPEGCPWDREQTHASLRNHLLEESYEVISAMDSGNVDGMREEFGDLLLQIVLNSQIASEDGEFSANDVIRGIYEKIVRRHPHVFGDVTIQGVDGVLANWEKIKEAERSEAPAEGGLLEGVPRALPALSQAQEYQDRAARVGFDWPEIQGVLDKITEEILEVRQASGADELMIELGDLMFALVNLCRWKKIDAESALRTANVRFKRRLGFIELGARSQRRRLSELSLEEMELLWQQAKTSGL
jgi:tetrapyrrole methylase family protein/MazG family protein